MNRLYLRFGLSCPFCGYGYRLGKIAFVSDMICLLLGVLYDWNLAAALLIPPLLVMVVGFFWCNRLTAQDRALIESADYLLWTPLTEEDRQQITKRHSPHFVMLLFMLLCMPLALMGGRGGPLTLEEFRQRAKILFIAALFAAFAAVLGHMNEKLWRSVDDTAVCAIVPVSSYYWVYTRTRRETITSRYMVIHLPEGRYVLEQHTASCSAVKLVRCKGMLCYIEIEKYRSV